MDNTKGYIKTSKNGISMNSTITKRDFMITTNTYVNSLMHYTLCPDHSFSSFHTSQTPSTALSPRSTPPLFLFINEEDSAVFYITGIRFSNFPRETYSP